MFSQDDMQELLTYEGNGDGVISVYLDTDSARQSTEAIKLTARGLLKEVQPQHEKDAQTIERYLELGYDWSKPGLALFCGQGGTFFRSYPSPVAFRNRIRLGPRPYVKPLAHFLDHYAHFGVIVVDRVSGRFYAYHLGEPQATEEFTGEEVRNLIDEKGKRPIPHFRSLTFSPDGKSLATGGDSGSVQLWDVMTGNELQKLTGDQGPVYSVAFTADGKSLAAGTSHGSVLLWDVARGQKMKTLGGREEQGGPAVKPTVRTPGAGCPAPLPLLTAVPASITFTSPAAFTLATLDAEEANSK